MEITFKKDIADIVKRLENKREQLELKLSSIPSYSADDIIYFEMYIISIETAITELEFIIKN